MNGKTNAKNGAGSIRSSSAILEVRAPTGSQVIATRSDGLVKKQNKGYIDFSDSDFQYFYIIIQDFEFSNLEWEVTASRGNESYTINLVINTNKKYYLKISYRVPSGYQAIEYLQNSTNAYYDTGIIPTTTNYTTEVKFQVSETNGGYLLGVEGGYRLRKPDGYSQIYYAYIDSETYFTVDGISTVGTDFDLIYNATGGQIILNGAVKATNANIRAKSDRQYSILIGACRYGSNVQYYGRWRYKEVIISERDTGNKLAELFPCYRKSDNVVGFWDKIGDKFVTHLGTGTVIAGPDL